MVSLDCLMHTNMDREDAVKTLGAPIVRKFDELSKQGDIILEFDMNTIYSLEGEELGQMQIPDKSMADEGEVYSVRASISPYDGERIYTLT